MMQRLIFAPSLFLPNDIYYHLSEFLGFLYFEEIRNFIYIPLIISLQLVLLFFGIFPKLYISQIPNHLYYEDLFIDEKKLPNYDVNNDIKEKYRQILCWSFIITNSLFLGGLAEYWFYRTHNSTSYMEIIGITGGIIRVFQMINTFIGKIILLVYSSPSYRKITYAFKAKVQVKNSNV